MRDYLANFRAKFSEITHDPLKFRGPTGKVINQRTEHSISQYGTYLQDCQT